MVTGKFIRVTLSWMLMLVACGGGQVAVAPLARFTSPLRFGMSAEDVRTIRPNAKTVEYAGLIEAGGWPGVNEVAYLFSPSKPDWLEKFAGRLVAVEFVMDSTVKLDSLRAELIGELGQATDQWCAATPNAMPESELQISRWETTVDRPQEITLRAFVRKSGGSGAVEIGRIVIAIRSGDSEVDDIGGLQQACSLVTAP
jgi:hypothetical protein